MGRHQFNAFRVNQYEQFIAGVKMYVLETRDYWSTLLKKRTNFIIICQDVWDSFGKEALGVQINFYNPVRQRYFAIPLGLEPVEDKRSDPTSIQVADLISMVGVESPDDNYLAVNDTTNASVKIGRNLTGKDGTCKMHTVQLAFKHAIGQVTRSANREITDEFKKLDALRKYSLKCGGYLMDKHSKGRWKKYLSSMKNKGRHAIKIPMPNSTRSFGFYLHLEVMIR